MNADRKSRRTRRRCGVAIHRGRERSKLEQVVKAAGAASIRIADGHVTALKSELKGRSSSDRVTAVGN